MKNRLWLIVGLTAAVLFWSFYTAMGGIAGIVGDPLRSLFVGAIAAAIFIPIGWIQYRNEKKKPPSIAPVADPDPGAPADLRLNLMPMELVASRPKLLVLPVLAALGFGVMASLLWRQPGVCRVIGLASIAPFAGLTLMLAIVGVLSPERLDIGPSGLRHTTFWRSRFWPWDEIRNISVMRGTLHGSTWTTGIRFDRFAPPDAAMGPDRLMLRAVWPIQTDELAQLLNAARLRFTPTRERGLIPVRKRFT